MTFSIGSAEVVAHNLITVVENEGPILIGRPHVGFGLDGTILRAYKYLGGAYDEELGSVDLTGLSGSRQNMAIMSIDPLIFALRYSSPARMYVANFTTGILTGPVTQDAGGGQSNSRTIYSGGPGGNGSIYWTRRSTSGGTFFKLWKLDIDLTHTEITPVGLEAAPGFNSSSGFNFMLGGNEALSPCYAGPPAGYIHIGNFQSVFVEDNDFLTFDIDDSEWTNWDGCGILANGDSLIHVPFTTSSDSASGIGKVDSDALFTQLYSQTFLGGVPSFADPSPDNLTIAVYRASDHVARVLADGSTNPITWEVVADMPIGGKPGQLWCLD